MQIWASPPSVKLVASGRHQSARSFSWHEHPFYELCIVLSGQCDWHLECHRHLSLRSGEAILLRPKTLHREEIKAGNGARLAWIGFDFAGPPPKWSQRVLTTDADFPEIAGFFEAIAREHHRSDLLSQVRVGLALQSILLLVARRAEPSARPLARTRTRAGSSLNPRQINRVESAAHYFRTNLQNSLSIAQVAAYHSLCPAHFSSLFRRHHRTSPRSFLRQARLERAGDLLTGSDLTLKEIAAQCGFVDAAHLCKSFKREQGVTPRAFRIASPPFSG